MYSQHALPILLLLMLTGCLKDETISAYAPGLWILDQQNGEAAASGITLELNNRGEVNGHAHCNGYNAQQSAPYPWLDIGAVQTTRLACTELDAETAYLALLASMTLAEVSGPVLILTNEAGETLEYLSYQP